MKTRRFKCQLKEDERVLVAPVSMLVNLAEIYDSFGRMPEYNPAQQKAWRECAHIVRHWITQSTPTETQYDE